MSRKIKRSHLMGASLFAGISAIALTAAAQTSATNGASLQILRHATEVANGRDVISTSSDLLVARRRTADRSILVYDAQNGAMTVERGDEITISPLLSSRGAEASYAYDYAGQTLTGDGAAVGVFNTNFQPVVKAAPKPGADATWKVATSLAALGVSRTRGEVTLSFTRTYLTVDGQATVLLEFEIPAFSYITPAGETAVHWARGFALTDAAFAQIHVLATQHRVSVMETDGDLRPVSVRTSLHGIDDTGGWAIDLNGAPRVRDAIARVREVSGDQVHPIATQGDSTATDPLPVMLARYLDMAALAGAEGGANPVPTAYDAATSPVLLQELLSPATGGGTSTADAAATVSAVGYGLGKAVSADSANTTPGAPPSSGGLQGSIAGQSSLVRAESLFQNNPSTSPAVESPDTSVRQQMLDGLSSPVQNDYGLMTPNPDGMPFTYPPATANLPTPDGPLRQETLNEMEARLAPPSGSLAEQTAVKKVVRVRVNRNTGEASTTNVPDAPPSSNGLLNSGLGQSSLVRAAALFENTQSPAPTTSGTEPSARQRMLDGLSHYIENDYQMMELNPDDKTFTYRQDQPEGVRSRPLIRRLEDVGTSSDPRPSVVDPDALQAPLVRSSLLSQTNGETPSVVDPNNLSTRNQLLEGLTQFVQNDPSKTRPNPGDPDSADDLDGLVRQLVETPDTDLRPRVLPTSNRDEAEPLPEWAKTNRGDAEQYAELAAMLKKQAQDLRAKDKEPPKPERKRSGDSSLDEFVKNNAFNYVSMVGIVETDLSRWQDWLATQNIRELERLALTAGYPNLASALADSSNILRQSQDAGYRRWAMQAPSCAGPAGCGPSYIERWNMKTSIVALGDVLDASREIFSSGGFTDIGISGLGLNYRLRDHSLEDGDIVRVRISQFGRGVYEGEISLTNLGQLFSLGLGRGVASLEIFAVNEGYSSPNTAQITVQDVVRGQGTQTYSLETGQTATLRIEAGAIATSGGNP